MKNLSRCGLMAAAVVLSAVPAMAQELKLSMANGRVTLVAQDVTLRQILAEWARIGDTRIVNGDKLMGPPISLQIVDCPEARALEILLREAAGYITAPRPANQPGASVYDRIMILATSKAPPPSAATAAPPPYRNMNVVPQQPMPAPVDEQDDPVDQGPVPPPGAVPQGVPQGAPVPGAQPYPVGVQQQPVMTSPRPGQLPLPQPPPGMNPYVPQPTAAPGQNPYAPNPYAPPPPGTVRQPGVQPRPGGQERN